MNEIKNSYGRQINFNYIDVSTPAGKALVREYGAMGTPTFIILDRDGNEVYRIQGVQPRQILEKALDEVIARQQESDN